MNRFTLLLCSCILLSAGCSPPPTQVSPSRVHSGVASQGPAVDGYEGIAVDFSEMLRIPGKYECAGTSVTMPDLDTSQEQDVTLRPLNKVLFRTTGTSHFQYDATFSKDCARLFYADALDTNVRIHVVDVASGAISLLVVPDSAFPETLVLRLGVDNPQAYFPTLSWLYSIDQDHLLLSFNNPNTGGDAFTNQTSQAIYDLTTHVLTFVAEGGGSPPLLLNYRTDTLIMPADPDRTGAITHRVEIDLKTGESTLIALTGPYNYTLPCDRNAFVTNSLFLNCRRQCGACQRL